MEEITLLRDSVTYIIFLGWMTMVQFSAEARTFLSATTTRPTKPPIHWVLEAFLPQGQSGWSMMMTSHLYLMLMLRKHRGIPFTPPPTS